MIEQEHPDCPCISTKNSGKPKRFPAVLTIDFPNSGAYNTGMPERPGDCVGGKKDGILYLSAAAGNYPAVHQGVRTADRAGPPAPGGGGAVGGHRHGAQRLRRAGEHRLSGEGGGDRRDYADVHRRHRHRYEGAEGDRAPGQRDRGAGGVYPPVSMRRAVLFLLLRR